MIYATDRSSLRPSSCQPYGLNMLNRLCIVLLSGLPCYLLASPAVASDLGPPDVPGPPNPVARPTFGRSLVNDLQLGSARIVMERTTLTDLARRSPKADIHHRGDAGDSLTWVCYTLPRSSGSIHIWLDSGELEGGNAIDCLLYTSFKSKLL